MSIRTNQGQLGAGSLARRCKRAMRRVDSAVEACALLAERLGHTPAEAEWLLDNRFAAERAAKAAAMALRQGGKLRQNGAGQSIVEMAAAELLRAEGWSMDLLRGRLAAFQETAALTEKELALLFPTLTLLLTEKLAELADRIRRMLSALAGEEPEGVFYAEAQARQGREQPPEVLREAKDRHRALAAEAEALFGALRFLETRELGGLLEEVSRVEQLFTRDPAGVYSRLDRESRALYRHSLSRLAKKDGLTEEAAATRVLELAGETKAHIGEYLFRRPLGREKRTHPAAYTASILLATLLADLGLAALSRSAGAALLGLLPLYETVRALSDWLLLKLVCPVRLPRLELPEGIPEGADTVCALTVLLTDERAVSAALRALEEFRLANRDAGERLRFALLADLKEAETESAEADAALIRAAKDGIEALNAQYGGFALFLRKRRYAARDRRWRGWERKRGAILELSAWLGGEENGLAPLCGGGDMRGSRYLIVLDADTRLTVGAAKELVAVMEHPLCRPVLDREHRRVTVGHGVLQPRVALDLAAAERSDFARLYGGQGGVDPYASVCCDLYQDLFDRGSFSGKGILDLESVRVCLLDRFPEERVLSHDLLEGELLRGGFVGDVELTDGFPARFGAYFERMHRWVRGDWQTLPWLLRHTPTVKGREENPLGLLSRWKIFDNLCRSLTAPVCLAALLAAALLGGPFCLAAGAALLCLASELLTAFADRLRRPGELLRRHYASRRAWGLSAVWLRFFLRLVFLPYEAYIALSACLTALYRMGVSRRGLLQWVTAAEAEGRGGDALPRAFLRQWFSLAAGAVLLLFALRPLPVALGVLWLLSPAASVALSRERSVSKRLSPEDTLWLKNRAAEIWRYFREGMTAERGFLPPDNVQEEPKRKAAERGSPTNFGLALLAPVAALDLGLCPREEALTLIRSALDTIEKLPRWKGLLYNWYDLKNRAVLHPAFVSTVDCGNLAACAAVLETALRELGETETAERAARLFAETDLSPLYDARRRLFRIGFNAETGELSEGCYDLMVSEARLTSYLALCRGWADRRHWRSLSRVLRRAAGHSGMASWSGSIFEYFMPGLFLENHRGSLMDDSLRLCLAAQRRRGRPWGISESAFAAFDPALNYRYKAHGVQALALKRGMDEERVVSPYSSFLALGLAPHSALRNLRRLAAMGMLGPWGFYEALDMTDSRCGKTPEPVRCVMAHHLGMSLLALDNVLAEGAIRRRFMSRPAFAAYRELLQEKGPVGQTIRRERPIEAAVRPDRLPAERWRQVRRGTDWIRPGCCLLSNGLYTVICTELGSSRSQYRGRDLTRFEGLRDGSPEGLSFFLFARERLLPLQPSTEDDAAVRRYSETETDRFRLYTAAEGVECCLETAVARGCPGELRLLRLSNLTEKPLRGTLVCALEPVLAPEAEYTAHPAFSKLCLESSLADGCVVFERRRASEAEEGLCAAFASSSPMSFDTFRQSAFGRGGLRALRRALTRPAAGTLGAMVEPCLLARVEIEIPAGGEALCSFALAAAENPEDAARQAREIIGSFRPADAVQAAAERLRLGPADLEKAMALLSACVFGWGRGEAALSRGRAGLWRFGVSGDRPVLAARCDRGGAEKLFGLIRRHALLYLAGFKADLAILTADGGEYLRPDETALRELAASAGNAAADCLHIFSASEEEASAFLAAADAILPLPEEERTAEAPEGGWFYPAGADNRVVYESRYEPDGSFVFDTRGGLGDTAWTLPLTNGRFGCLAADCGAGFLWDRNARERRLTPWVNDPLADRGGEELYAEAEGERVSLFAACDGWDCRARFGFGWAEWEKRKGTRRLRTRVCVPAETDARLLLIEQSGFDTAPRLVQRLRPVLGDKASAARAVRFTEEGGGVAFRSTEPEHFSAAFAQLASLRPASCRRVPWEKQGWELVYPLEERFILVSGTDQAVKLKTLTTWNEAEAALEDCKAYWRKLCGQLWVKSPSPRLDAWLNGWALYQTVACRVLARTSLYQSGGAYGFRDQLQDAGCAAPFVPELARERILAAASHQYREGDVMHWWHEGEEGDRGVRTRCSDDLLWLPWAAARLIDVTGDASILAEERPWLSSPSLAPEEKDRYEQAAWTEERAPLLAHCLRAIDCFLARPCGPHGLPDMGSGDWNDGFDRVRGESVWLAWFGAMVLRDFAPLCPERRGELLREAKRLGEAADAAWDGVWYRRGYMADGSPIGSAACEECRIDSVAQSFAVLSGFGEPGRARQAVLSAYERLYDPKSRTVRLFDPPFDRGSQEPGYIRRYLPGVRENGGQYTHAAVWLAMALLRCGEREKGLELIEALLPGGRDPAVYKTEPYVLAADVYTASGHLGRGGWSWYTGAAGWLLRAVTEELLGLRMRDGRWESASPLPSGWEHTEIRLNGERFPLRNARSQPSQGRKTERPRKDS